MKQQLTFVTLGVNDLAMMSAWYVEKFGWTPFRSDEGICFFRLQTLGTGNLILGLYPADHLADDVGVINDGSGFKRFTLAINLASEEEVNRVTNALREKGVRIIREPEPVFWGGYRGYIADPEDNYWELAYNPFLKEEMMK